MCCFILSSWWYALLTAWTHFYHTNQPFLPFFVSKKLNETNLCLPASCRRQLSGNHQTAWHCSFISDTITDRRLWEVVVRWRTLRLGSRYGGGPSVRVGVVVQIHMELHRKLGSFYPKAIYREPSKHWNPTNILWHRVLKRFHSFSLNLILCRRSHSVVEDD
jgi:hypothetical protein